MIPATLTPPDTHNDDLIVPTTANLRVNRSDGIVTTDGHHHYTHLFNRPLGVVFEINDTTWAYATYVDITPRGGTTDTKHRALEELLDTWTAGGAQ